MRPHLAAMIVVLAVGGVSIGALATLLLTGDSSPEDACRSNAKDCSTTLPDGTEPPECRSPPCPTSRERSVEIDTWAGTLTLRYENGTATLNGTLIRSTPCVGWETRVSSTRDYPPSSVEFNLLQTGEEQICIQVLGTPQSVTATSPASENTNYTVRLREEIIFTGVLSVETSTIKPEDPAKIGLSPYPDRPIDEPLVEPLSVTYLIEHRSALNGQTVRVKGLLAGMLLGEKACPPDRGMCAQPSLFLTDTLEPTRNPHYDLRVLVGEAEHEEDHRLGDMLEVRGTVYGDHASIVFTKLYP